MTDTSGTKEDMTVVGLFAGIGGLELGLKRAGLGTELLCEIEPSAQVVLRKHFDDVPLESDITRLQSLPSVDVVAAGFPCQNLSLVGRNDGIFGRESGLIKEVFRLLETSETAPKWLLLENVPFMLRHNKAHAIRHITRELARLGYRWAHRTVDTRAFGLPQRRRRVFLLASKTEDPRRVLFADDAGLREVLDCDQVPCGFSWTEGRLGLGWAINAVPTLKGGSAIGIPSPPAIWFRQQDLAATPDIRDAERLQGFEADWTDIVIDGKTLRPGFRWKLVGNAVSVPVAEWIGSRLVRPGEFDSSLSPGELSRSVWPNAAWGEGDKVYPVEVSEWPCFRPYTGIGEFLTYPMKPLSAKATAGFLKRARSSSLNFVDGFLDSLEVHLQKVLNRDVDGIGAVAV